MVENSQIGELRRYCAALLESSTLDDVAKGRVAIIANELAGNLIRHARDGEILVRPIREPADSASSASSPIGGIELLAIDRGPGIANLEQCLRDGYTTGTTPGTGLGAIRRQACFFDAYSTLDRGTVMVAQVTAGEPAPAGAKPGFRVGAICLALAGETRCGDSWAQRTLTASRTEAVLVVDGIGHGFLAAEAARAATDEFRRSSARSASAMLADLHQALKSGRGAAASVAYLDPEAGTVDFAGIGNVLGAVLAPGAGSSAATQLGSTMIRRTVSMPGTLGHQTRKIQAFKYPWPAGGSLLLHSDGLGSQWDLSAYPGIDFRHPSLVAGVLYRDHSRRSDDVTVLVMQEVTE